MQLHSSRTARTVYKLLGSSFLILGMVGIFLPLLPTTPFVLLAAACYARSSERFYQGLLKSRHFGPVIENWQQHRCIPTKTKRIAVILIILTFGISIGFAVDQLYLRIALVALAAVLILNLRRIPSCK